MPTVLIEANPGKQLPVEELCALGVVIEVYDRLYMTINIPFWRLGEVKSEDYQITWSE